MAAPEQARKVKDDRQTVGQIVSFMRDGELEVGYWLDRAFWGRGIASQALSAFLQLEQRRPLHAGVAKHNLASIRVLQKCGFTPGPSEIYFRTLSFLLPTILSIILSS